MEDADLGPLLRAWPWTPGPLAVRTIEGADERPKIQVRLELGILQMEIDGRPDGLRPEGAESLLAHYAERIAQEGATVTLDAEACRGLREEAVQYYHRYVALFALRDYRRTVRDTSRNLTVMDLCRDHAEREEDRTVLEQFRPSIATMRTRAEAELAIAEERPKEALAALDRGIEEIGAFLAERMDPEEIEESGELQLLRGMRDTLVPKLPVSQRAELLERLRAALDAENYELAAILRDELRLL